MHPPLHGCRHSESSGRRRTRTTGTSGACGRTGPRTSSPGTRSPRSEFAPNRRSSAPACSCFCVDPRATGAQRGKEEEEENPLIRPHRPGCAPSRPPAPTKVGIHTEQTVDPTGAQLFLALGPHFEYGGRTMNPKFWFYRISLGSRIGPTCEAVFGGLISDPFSISRSQSLPPPSTYVSLHPPTEHNRSKRALRPA